MVKTYLKKKRNQRTRRFLSTSIFPRSVSSDTYLPIYRVKPFQLIVDIDEAWPAIKKEIELMDRAQVVEQTHDSMTAHVKSKIFRFVDVLDLVYRPKKNTVGVRSAAKIGFYDFGVNRSRVERLRSALKARGVIA